MRVGRDRRGAASIEIVTLPLLLLGLGIGALASQSPASPSAARAEPRGRRPADTATNIGASLGGVGLIAIITATVLTGIQGNPAVPPDLQQKAEVELSGGVPFLADADVESALEEARVSGETTAAIIAENQKARLRALRSAPAIIALVAAAALPFTGPIPTRQPGSHAPQDTRDPQRTNRAPT